MPHPGSLRADFGRFGIDLWHELELHDPAARVWRDQIDLLNEWRNAIAHQDFTSPRLGGIIFGWQWSGNGGPLAGAWPGPWMKFWADICKA